MPPYLTRLALRLAAATARAPERSARHAAFLMAAQRPDGGFAGRQGNSDLYYTSFGLRGLGLVAPAETERFRRGAYFVAGQLADALLPVDQFSALHASLVVEALAGIEPFALAGQDRRQVVGQMLDSLRHPGGGYAKSSASRHASTYHTFLAVTAADTLELPHDDPAAVAATLHACRNPDGGFSELALLRRSGTNPTAAALVSLDAVGELDATTRAGGIAFLGRQQMAEGGFAAHTSLPVCDLLSTFTSLAALADLNGLATIDMAAARRFVAACELPNGGFRAGLWSDAADVEYAFYGLGSHALLDPAE